MGSKFSNKMNATTPQKAPKGTIGQRHVLQVLAYEYGWRTMVEVGVWKAGTSEYLLTNCPGIEQWVGVDPYRQPEGDLSQPGFCNYGFPDMDAVHREAAVRVAKFGDRARLIRCPSVDCARLLSASRFDAVFIDGDHRREFVAKDIDAWAPLCAGGVLCGHDFDMPSVMEGVYSRFPADDVRVLPDRVWMVRL